MTGTVVIDCFPDCVHRYADGYAIVAVDVIRATTTATTAVSLGRPLYLARTTDEAAAIATGLTDPLLVGELGGHMPYGFHETNSPAAIAGRADVHRPMILISSSGTDLILNAAGRDAVYLACLRNYSAVARCLAGRHARVAVLGAGTRGRFRREDQMGCARVAAGLLEAGYQPENRETADYVARWSDVSPEEIRGGESAEYLRRTGQEHDLEFVLRHIDDLVTVPRLVDGNRIVARPETRAPTSRARQAVGGER